MFRASLVSLALTTAQNTSGDGVDTLSGFESLTGSAFNDTLIGDAGANAITGGAGNDTIMGGLGNDTLDGGAGTDTASYVDAASSVIVSLANTAAQQTGGAGIDTLAGFERLTGSAFNDTLTGDDANNIIDGGAGDDLINGGLGNDSLNGGAGNDTVNYSDAATSVRVTLASVVQNNTAAGRDQLIGIENITGTSFGDNLSGDGGANIIWGGAGNDTINGNDGDDLLVGGAGNDMLTGGNGIDTASYDDATAAVTVSLALGTVQGTVGAGNDTLVDIENLTGSAFNDILTGNAGANVIHGGGNDIINGGAGNDLLDGGVGADTLSYADAAAGVSVSLAILTAQATIGAGLDTVSGFENLLGSTFADHLYGDGLANRVDGGAGDDMIIAGGGDDFVIGGLDNDTLDGGAGNDTLSYEDSVAAVMISLGMAGPQDSGGAGVDSLTGFENLIGSKFADTLTGDGGSNLIRGGVGNDIINGGAGADQLFGESGVDIINGGAGQDVLTGGGSGDRFVFSTAADSAIGFDDTITDFHHAEKDRIDLSGVYGGTFSFIGSSGFTGHAGQLGFSAYDSDILVAGDINGDGIPDFEIKLIGAASIEAADFFL